MSAQTIAFLACRLLAVFILVTQGIKFMIEAIAVQVFTPPADSRMWMASAILIPIYCVVFSILWFGAGPVSQRIARNDSRDVDPKMTLDQWQALVVSALGCVCLLFAVRALGALAQAHVYNTINMGGSHRVAPEMVLIGIQSAAGIIFLGLPHNIVSGLNALRAWIAHPLIKTDHQ
jgi:hypothetical protein